MTDHIGTVESTAATTTDLQHFYGKCSCGSFHCEAYTWSHCANLLLEHKWKAEAIAEEVRACP
jgi:hypothetical protein